MFRRSRSGVRVTDAAYPRARALARQLDLPENATRAQLISALARSRLIVASLPEAVDDTDDLEHVLRMLPPGGLGAAPPTGWRAVVPVVPSRQPHYTIKVRAVLCADSDGFNAANITENALATLFKELSTFYFPVGLSFVHSTTVLPNTTINQDFTLPAGANLSSAVEPISKAEKDASFKQHNEARNTWARQYPGQLVVFFRYGTSVTWNATAQTWVVGPATFAFSGADAEFVAMNQGTESILMAHEAGHYFHLGHTHGGAVTLTDAEKAQYDDPDNDPADHEGRRQLLRAKAVEAIRGYVDDKGHAPELGLNVFDADGLADTRPDPSPQIFHYEYGDACQAKTLGLDVLLQSGPRPYTLDPPRDIIMSYFFRCSGSKRFSDQQMDKIRASLETVEFSGKVLSRNHLINVPLKVKIPKYLPKWRLEPPLLSRVTAPIRNLIRRTPPSEPRS